MIVIAKIVEIMNGMSVNLFKKGYEVGMRHKQDIILVG